MKRILFIAAVLFAAMQVQGRNHVADSLGLEGRWDLTLVMDGKEAPSWLEIKKSGTRTLVGYFVGVSGSARPVSVVNVRGSEFSFAIPPQWEEGTNDLSVTGSINGGKLSGTIVFPDGKSYQWTGVRAPLLREQKKAQWGKTVNLIQPGLKGWHASGENQWVIKDGILTSPKPGSNLITDQKFKDFKIHAEFRYPKNGNSGIYLRGRYEVQIADSKGLAAASVYQGGVYGFVAPSDQVAAGPGEWQSYDVTLIGRMVTIVCNGKTVVTNQEIPGITGGALDSNEGEPGPIMLQGDHEPVEFRALTITPAVEN